MHRLPLLFMMDKVDGAVESLVCLAEPVVGTVERNDTRRARTHAEIMRELGYETPDPIPKRFRNAWDHLVSVFPCPSELQHRLWAVRIKRMFEEDCGFPVDWTCECRKCMAGTSAEICNFYEAANGNDCSIFDNMDVEEWEGSSVDTLEIRRVTRGEEVDIPRTRYQGDEVWEGNDNAVIRYVHLFLDEERLENSEFPGTPFTTAVGVLNGGIRRHRPRLMWVRARRLVPTQLFFN